MTQNVSKWMEGATGNLPWKVATGISRGRGKMEVNKHGRNFEKKPW